jgi:hypothetical protein
MPVLTLIVFLVVVGIALWAANTYIPMDPKIKTILNVVAVVIVIVWLLSAFGIIHALSGAKVPTLK